MAAWRWQGSGTRARLLRPWLPRQTGERVWAAARTVARRATTGRPRRAGVLRSRLICSLTIPAPGICAPSVRLLFVPVWALYPPLAVAASSQPLAWDAQHYRQAGTGPGRQRNRNVTGLGIRPSQHLAPGPNAPVPWSCNAGERRVAMRRRRARNPTRADSRPPRAVCVLSRLSMAASSRPVHWEYRGRASGRHSAPVRSVLFR